MIRLSPLLLLLACETTTIGQGTQIGQEGDPLPCAETEEPVPDPSVSAGALPFTVDAWVERFSRPATGTLALADGSAEPFALGVTATGPAMWWSEVLPEGEDPTVPRCLGQAYRVPVTVELDAGLTLWNAVDGVLEAREIDAGTFAGGAAPEGTLAPETLDPAALLTLELFVSGSRNGETWAGELTWVGTAVDEQKTEPAGTWTAVID